MEIIKNMLKQEKYKLKSPYEMEAELIVVHNTANDASAQNEIAYMIRNDSEVSFHYAIDDKEIVQGIPENRNAWHCGDGHGKGNRKGIAIEICYSKSGGERFIKAEKLAAKFIAAKLKEKGWGIDKVKKHQDFSGKYCPHRTLDMGWDRFLKMIQAEMAEKSNVLYRVQVGAYSVKANAEAMLAKLKKAGFDGFIVESGTAEVKPVEPAKPVLKSIDEIAKEVINGDWGNGDERKNRLEKAGYDYYAVQKRVNELL